MSKNATLSKGSLFAKLDRVSNFEELSKLVDIDVIVKSYKFYITSKIAHKAYNDKKTKLYKLALLHGLDK